MGTAHVVKILLASGADPNGTLAAGEISKTIDQSLIHPEVIKRLKEATGG